MNNFVCDECIWYNNTVYLLHVEVASAQRVRIWRVQCGDLEYVSFNWTFQDTNRNSIKGSGEFLDTVERSVRRSGLEKLCRGCADGREVLLQFGDQMWGRGGTNSPRQPLPKASWSRDFCENLHGPKSSEPHTRLALGVSGKSAICWQSVCEGVLCVCRGVTSGRDDVCGVCVSAAAAAAAEVAMRAVAALSCVHCSAFSYVEPCPKRTGDEPVLLTSLSWRVTNRKWGVSSSCLMK